MCGGASLWYFGYGSVLLALAISSWLMRCMGLSICLIFFSCEAIVDRRSKISCFSLISVIILSSFCSLIILSKYLISGVFSLGLGLFSQLGQDFFCSLSSVIVSSS